MLERACAEPNGGGMASLASREHDLLDIHPPYIASPYTKHGEGEGIGKHGTGRGGRARGMMAITEPDPD